MSRGPEWLSGHVTDPEMIAPGLREPPTAVTEREGAALIAYVRQATRQQYPGYPRAHRARGLGVGPLLRRMPRHRWRRRIRRAGAVTYRQQARRANAPQVGSRIRRRSSRTPTCRLSASGCRPSNSTPSHSTSPAGSKLIVQMEPVDLLVFGPHPDDIEIGLGGTVAKHAALGCRVGLCDLTAGEMGSNGTVHERLAEADAARAVLGARWRVNLRWPDRAIDRGEARGRGAIDSDPAGASARGCAAVLVRPPSGSRRRQQSAHRGRVRQRTAPVRRGGRRLAPGVGLLLLHQRFGDARRSSSTSPSTTTSSGARWRAIAASSQPAATDAVADAADVAAFQPAHRKPRRAVRRPRRRPIRRRPDRSRAAPSGYSVQARHVEPGTLNLNLEPEP